MVRSANTGISCFISPSGKIFDAQPWDKAAVIKMSIPQLSTITFYARYGDIISKIAIGFAVILLLISTFTLLKKLKK